MPSHSDVVTAEVGASAALAGLVLVFLGVIVGSFQTLRGQAGRDVLGRFRNAGWIAMGAFLLATASLVVGICWLAAGGGRAFYIVALVVFFAAVAGLVVVAVYSAARVLLR